tara:strand:- start:1843 stop:2043 length:201 start_codon:yes stop_codon:yes gene_type:complete
MKKKILKNIPYAKSNNFKKYRRNFLKILSLFLFFPNKAFSKNYIQNRSKILIKKSNFVWFLDKKDK